MSSPSSPASSSAPPPPPSKGCNSLCSPWTKWSDRCKDKKTKKKINFKALGLCVRCRAYFYIHAWFLKSDLDAERSQLLWLYTQQRLLEMSRLMQEFGQHSNLYHSNLIILKPTCSVSLKMDQTGYNYKEMHKRNGCWVFFTALLQLQIRNPLVRQRTANRYYQWWCYQFTFHRDIQLLSPAHLPNENDPKTSKAVTLPSSLLQDLLQRYSFVSNMYFESTIFWIQIHLPHFVWHSVDISLAALLLSQFPSSAFHSECMHNVAWKHPDYAKYTAKPWTHPLVWRMQQHEQQSHNETSNILK